MSVGLAVALLVLKFAGTIGSLRAGASGGLLTPGLSIGALTGIVLGAAWSHVWPLVPSGAFAIVGATAFLAVSMQMPITAVVLVFEMTRAGYGYLVPVILAVSGALAAAAFLEQRWQRVQ